MFHILQVCGSSYRHSNTYHRLQKMLLKPSIWTECWTIQWFRSPCQIWLDTTGKNKGQNSGITSYSPLQSDIRITCCLASNWLTLNCDVHHNQNDHNTKSNGLLTGVKTKCDPVTRMWRILCELFAQNFAHFKIISVLIHNLCYFVNDKDGVFQKWNQFIITHFLSGWCSINMHDDNLPYVSEVSGGWHTWCWWDHFLKDHKILKAQIIRNRQIILLCLVNIFCWMT